MKTNFLKIILLLLIIFFNCSLKVSAIYRISSDRKSENIKILLILPSNLGANFNYNLDIMEEFGWEITTASITRTASPCPWGINVGLQPFEVDTLISEINDISGYDVIAIMPSSWQAVSASQAYLDLLNDPHCLNLIQNANAQNKVIWTTCAGSRVLAAANIINGIHIQGKTPFIAEYQAAGGLYMGDTSLPIIENNIITCTKDMWYCYQNTEAIATALENQNKKIPKFETFQFKQKPINLNKGDVNWAYTFGAELSEGIKAMCFTSDNSYLLAGNTYSLGAGFSDILIIKTDTSSNVIWTKTYGDSGWEYAYDVIQSYDGNILIAGYTTSYGSGSKDMYLLKTDNNGNLIWSKTYGGSGLDVARCVVETNDHHYLLLGYTESFDSGKGDIYLIKTDSAGNICWTKTFGGIETELGKKIKIAADGNYLILGTTGSKGAGKSDFNLIKTDTSGNIIWDKTYGTANYQESFDFIQTLDNGYAIIGHSDIHGVDLNQTYLVKTDSNGTKLWEQFYGSSYGFYDYGKAILELPDGKLLICGNSKIKNTRKNDVWIVITDQNGNQLWNDFYGGSLSDWATSILPTLDGGFVFAGHTESFGSGTFDAWLVKISNPLLSIYDIKQKLSSDYINVKPNPFNSSAYISVYIPANQTGEMLILDIYGNVIKTFPTLSPGLHELNWDGTNNDHKFVNTGIYFINLKLPDNYIVKKILLL